MMKKIFFVLLFLTGCGFSPLYQSKNINGGNVPVQVAPIPDQYGFNMHQAIQNKLGRAENTKYLLKVDPPSFDSWDQTIDSKNFATVMGISGTVSYSLTEKASHKVILKS